MARLFASHDKIDIFRRNECLVRADLPARKGAKDDQVSLCRKLGQNVSGRAQSEEAELTSSAINFLVRRKQKCGRILLCMTPSRSWTRQLYSSKSSKCTDDGHDHLVGSTLVTLATFNRIDHKIAPFGQGTGVTSMNLMSELAKLRLELTKSKTLHISSSRFWISVPVRAKQLAVVNFFKARAKRPFGSFSR